LLEKGWIERLDGRLRITEAGIDALKRKIP
jgi:hypothetical protein